MTLTRVKPLQKVSITDIAFALGCSFATALRHLKTGKIVGASFERGRWVIDPNWYLQTNFSREAIMEHIKPREQRA